MSPVFKKAVTFMLLSVCFWVPALVFLGLMMVPECFDAVAACEQEKRARLAKVVVVEATVYLILVGLWLHSRRRSL